MKYRKNYYVRVVKRSISCCLAVLLLFGVGSCSKDEKGETKSLQSETASSADNKELSNNSFDAYMISSDSNDVTSFKNEREYYSDRVMPDENEPIQIDPNETMSRSGSDGSLASRLGKIPDGAVVIEAKDSSDAYAQLEKAIENRATWVYCYPKVELKWIDLESMSYGAFWLHGYGGGYVYGRNKDDYICDYFTFEYEDLTDDEIVRMKEEIDHEADRIISLVPDGSDDWNKAKIVHDELVRTITYDTSLVLPHTHDLYGALVYHNAVCSAYASAYKYILNKMGIECRIVSSDPVGGNTSGHAWNVAVINGIETYIDATWDDYDYVDSNGNKYIHYTYFGLTQYEVQSVDAHMVDHESYRASTDDPTSVNYYIHENYYLTSFDKDAITNIFKQQYENGDSTFSVRFANKADYDQMVALVGSSDVWSILRSAGFEGEYIMYFYDDLFYSVTIAQGSLEKESVPTPPLYDFIDRLYSVALNRHPDPVGKADWINRLHNGATGADCVRGFLLSEEFKARNLSDDAFIDVLYLTMFNRKADDAGKKGWLTKMADEGYTREAVIEDFINSEEFKSMCLAGNIQSGGVVDAAA